MHACKTGGVRRATGRSSSESGVGRDRLIVPPAVWTEKPATLCKNFGRRRRKADQMGGHGARGWWAEIAGSSYYCYRQLYRVR